MFQHEGKARLSSYVHTRLDMQGKCDFLFVPVCEREIDRKELENLFLKKTNLQTKTLCTSVKDTAI